LIEENSHSVSADYSLWRENIQKAAAKDVGRAMHEFNHRTLTSSGSGERVKNRKQAIAIGLSEARGKGKQVPRKKTTT
jgi:Family of unknown function (DUF6496)